MSIHDNRHAGFPPSPRPPGPRLPGRNPYGEQVQGKANEPITVLMLLQRAARELGLPETGATPMDVVERLDENAPRIAIVGGSPDHPAHVLDHVVALRAAWRIWDQGGVPFWFSVPVMCDGTAQSTAGMAYSLQSRNVAAEIIVNQMEAQQYHGAFVLQGCDKTPFGAVCALAHLDAIRRGRGDLPVFASFAPAHVLRGGTIPPDARAELEALAARAEAAGRPAIAEDLRDALAYILQCTSTQAVQGVLSRAAQEDLLAPEAWRRLERTLAAHTCHASGGICAFNGTGNSSRLAVAALGLVHPAVELLPEPPDQARVNAAVDALLDIAGDEALSAGRIVDANFANAVRVHSATGGSTNLMMHLVAARVYAGRPFDVAGLDAIRRAVPVPDLFDYSLTAGRDHFALARQTAAGQIRGMETLFQALERNGVPMDLDAPTVTGGTWRQRLAGDGENRRRGEGEKGGTGEAVATGPASPSPLLPFSPTAGAPANPVILSRPRRPVSGADVLAGNFFETAVVKISGIPERQLDEFDGKVAFVLYYESEEDANAGLLDVRLLEKLRDDPRLTVEALRRMAAHNAGPEGSPPAGLDREGLWAWMVEHGALKLAVAIGGQGPRAIGMPEMFTPMQHINANRGLRRLAVLLSDGRYSGVTYGAAIGHVTPEAVDGGGILFVETGDLLHLRLCAHRVDLLDAGAFRRSGEVRPGTDVFAGREPLAAERKARMLARRRAIAATNRMDDVTDAARGVVPGAVWRWAEAQDVGER